MTPEELKYTENWIIACEDLRNKPYVDTVGKITIGVGRNLTDIGITNEEALYLMKNDINRCIKELETYSWYINQPSHVQMALLNMNFNIGITKLKGFKKMISALMDKNYTQASIEALDSVWATQVGKRAKDIALMIRQGI